MTNPIANAAPIGSRHSISHDGFTGTVIGHYERLDGKRGVVLQQDGTKVVHVYGERWIGAADTPSDTAEAMGEAVSPEDRAEQYIQSAVDRAPEPLRRLGDWLANKLDEDDWKTAERMLLGAAIARPAPEAEDEMERLTRERDAARSDLAMLTGRHQAERVACANLNHQFEKRKDAAEAALAETERQRETIAEAFVAVCRELGCELDNEAALIAAHTLRERLATVEGALRSLGFTFAEDGHGGTKTMPASSYQQIARAALSPAQEISEALAGDAQERER